MTEPSPSGTISGFILSARSNERLGGVHKDLSRIVRRALQLGTVDFAVLEGRRTIERQDILYQSGATRTLNSRHLTGHAVDLGAWVGGALRWDWPLYEKINMAMLLAAAEMHIPIEWGGDWQSFRDGPHFQLPWGEYPILRPSRLLAVAPQDEASRLSRNKSGVTSPNEVSIPIPHPEEPPKAASRRAGAPQNEEAT